MEEKREREKARGNGRRERVAGDTWEVVLLGARRDRHGRWKRGMKGSDVKARRVEMEKGIGGGGRWSGKGKDERDGKQGHVRQQEGRREE